MLKKIAATGVVASAAAGVMLLSAPAYAGAQTSGDASVLGGNQVIAPISIPVDVCGNAVAVIGVAGAGCQGGAKTGHASHY
ncbi:MAG TPA: chaplin family protein [Streptosporangiaceae bacterium]